MWFDPKLVRMWCLLIPWLLAPFGLTAHAQALLPGEVQAVDVTGDTVVNLTLPSGLILSGSVRTERGAPVGLGTLAATSATSIFEAGLQSSDSSYRMVLPPGTYDVHLSIPFLDVEELEIPTLVYMASDAMRELVITSDTAQDWVVPNLPELATVTGFVTPEGVEPDHGTLRFVSTDGKILTLALFEDVYTARMPLQAYHVSASLVYTDVTEPSRPRTTAQVQVDLETVAVNESLTLYDPTLPVAIRLSGRVFDSAGAPIAPARVEATAVEAGATAPDAMDFRCRLEATFSFSFLSMPMPVSGTAFIPLAAGEGSTLGAYQMPLPAGTYRLGVTLGLELQAGGVPTVVDLDTSSSRILYVSMPEVALTADTAQDVSVPALPPVATITGQVTDALGQPVAGAVVKAMTSTLAGISGAARLLATAQTQDDGTYSLPVLSGTNYTLLACPPN